MSSNLSEKRALIARKERILKEIQNTDRRIDEVGRSTSSPALENEDESDSDTDFKFLKDSGPSILKLKRQEAILKTCIQATQELSGVEVLQSEVTVMVQDPVLDWEPPVNEEGVWREVPCPVSREPPVNEEGVWREVPCPVSREPPVNEEGVWREVTAECCIDLVPFAISFYTHRASRKFAPDVYRGLRVAPVKAAHRAELAKSVLPGLRRPSDAIEVLRSYAVAHRSRRTTLARLAGSFASSLFMEPLAEGGYQLKCADLLEVSWTLQNKWSPIAPFLHRMKFDLEFMDESYIKTITQAHRELCDPAVDTDDRIRLLSKIVSTCLEAQGPTKELHDSLSSDPESAKQLEKRRTNLDREQEAPVVKKSKDSDVMAPPKLLPKKSKAKVTENSDASRKSSVRAVKRSVVEENSVTSIKKVKTNEIVQLNENKTVGKDERKAVQDKKGVADAKNKNSNATSKIEEKSTSKKVLGSTEPVVKNVKKSIEISKSVTNKNTDVTKTIDKGTNAVTNNSERDLGKMKNVQSAGRSESKGNMQQKKGSAQTGNVKNSGKNVNKIKNSTATTTNINSNTNSNQKDKVINKDKAGNNVNNIKNKNTVATEKNETQKDAGKVKKVTSVKNKDATEPNNLAKKKKVVNSGVGSTKSEQTDVAIEKKNLEKAQVKNVASNIGSYKISGNKDNQNIVKQKGILTKNNEKALTKNPIKTVNKKLTGNTNVLSNIINKNKNKHLGETDKENGDQSKQIISKIPLKIVPSSVPEGFKKKPKLRVSPRK